MSSIDARLACTRMSFAGKHSGMTSSQTESQKQKTDFIEEVGF